MSWATEAEALSITGEALTQDELDRAMFVLEIYVEITDEYLPVLKPTDIRHLKKAEAYQAAWMRGRVAPFEQKDVDGVIQDGLSYHKGDTDAHVLSPFANRAIQKLSWRKSRTASALTPQQALVLRKRRLAETIGVDPHGFMTDADDHGGWVPM